MRYIYVDNYVEPLFVELLAGRERFGHALAFFGVVSVVVPELTRALWERSLVYSWFIVLCWWELMDCGN